MGNYQEYQRQVAEWRREYNVPEPKPTLDLTKVKIRVCCKCGKRSGTITRHHKGHEYLWARLLPSVYAHRYILFLDEDCVDLCEKDHLKIHKLYEPRLEPLWPLLNKQDGQIDYKQAERFRQKLIRVCERWLKEKKHAVQQKPQRNKSRRGNTRSNGKGRKRS